MTGERGVWNDRGGVVQNDGKKRFDCLWLFFINQKFSKNLKSFDMDPGSVARGDGLLKDA
jgi:hypothetical protein